MKSAIMLRKSINRWVVFFIVALMVSGCTAFALESELAWLNNFFNRSETPLHHWIFKVYTAIHDSNEKYPFLAYGYDWLAFAHIVISVAFIGVLKDPVRNKWIIQFGRIACIMIFPLAFIAGHARSIPIGWQFIDCSFGLLGLIPLTICYGKIERLELLLSK